MLDASTSIVITSHVSPDPDAVCSSVLLCEIIRHNFPGKKVVTALEEYPSTDLSFITGYDQIVFAPLVATIEANRPDLLIITDADSYDRVTKLDGATLREYVKANGLKTIVIDHHELSNIDQVDLLINRGRAAASQEVYWLCFEALGLNKPEGFAQTTMIGILDDTNRFMYYYPHYSETLAIAGQLIEAGVDVQKLDARLRRYTLAQMAVFSHLASNIQVADGYTYTFISDQFAQDWLATGKAVADFKRGKAHFVDQYIRNIGENMWGFLIAQDLTTPGVYFSSFRATRGSLDAAKLAQSLGGNGHAESAAAKIEAASVNEAIQKVRVAIKKYANAS